MIPPDEPRQLRDSLDRSQRELATARARLEVLEEGEAEARRARHRLAELTRYLDDRLSRTEGRSRGVRGFVRRRLGRNVAAPAEAAETKLLRKSRLFDGRWYLAAYPEVVKTGLSPALHYLRVGAAEGKDPGPLFSTKHYQALHPQIARTGVNPLLNHLRTGQ